MRRRNAVADSVTGNTFRSKPGGNAAPSLSTVLTARAGGTSTERAETIVHIHAYILSTHLPVTIHCIEP